MRFFNIDQHVSVIWDVATIFKRLGHEVDDWTLSGHHWVAGKEKRRIPLSDGTALTCSGVCTQEVCDRFYEANKDELSKYDGFICCYPIEFALLYERFNKPIICVNCVRYEHPNTFNPALRSRLDEYLKKKHAQGQLYYVCNNKGDRFYTEFFLGIRGTHIPSLCDYTNAKYTGTRNQYVIHDRSEISLPSDLAVGLGHLKANSGDWRYKWPDLYSYKGVVHAPYHNGSMSIFEQYTANVPMFFPTKRLAKEMFHQRRMLNDLTFYRINNKPEPDDLGDPNSLRNPDILEKWFDSMDFWDEWNMPHVQLFDNVQHLEHLLRTTDCHKISEQMAAYNAKRNDYIMSSWQQILAKL